MVQLTCATATSGFRNFTDARPIVMREFLNTDAKARPQLLLQFRAAVPMPAKDIHNVGVGRKRARIGLYVRDVRSGVGSGLAADIQAGCRVVMPLLVLGNRPRARKVGKLAPMVPRLGFVSNCS